MASAQDLPQNEDYNSASDADFDPNAPKETDDSSSSEDEAPGVKSKKRKDTAPDLDFENSGDEATISKGRRKKRKTGTNAREEDDGGDGGLIKTRAQRRAEVQEKKPIARAGQVSVDVNALWAQMSAPSKPVTALETNKVSDDQDGLLQAPSRQTGNGQEKQAGTESVTKTFVPQTDANNDMPAIVAGQASEAGKPSAEGTITIKRTYEFAGQKMEEERVVLASSEEARLYLEEQSRANGKVDRDPKPPLRRPKKRASMFGSSSGANPFQEKAQKLNTIEKSKLDWAAHVDQEGISDELKEHHRAKGDYLGRMDFLGRMEAKREDEHRSMKPK